MTSRRQQILEAFRRRLRHYGYDKTTMSEIAGDVGISVGTLYLEFDSKEDILAGLMEETARRFEEAFREVVESPLPWAEKLKEVLRKRIELSDRCCREGAHGGEVLLAGAPKCRRMSSEKEALYLGLLEELIRGGVAAGELETPEPAQSARILRDAIASYLPPMSVQRPSEEVIERSQALVDLLVRGLQPHPAGV